MPLDLMLIFLYFRATKKYRKEVKKGKNDDNDDEIPAKRSRH